MPRVFVSRRSRRRTLLLLAAAALSLVGTTYLFARFAPWLSNPRAIRTFVLSFGPLAPLAFLFLQAGQVVFAPVPGAALGFVSGYLFGSVAGTVYSVAGATLGSAVAFSLARRYGRPYVQDTVDPAVLAQFDDLIDAHGLFGLFLVFLVPGLPDDAICFVAGCTNLPVRKMIVVSAVGRVPGYFLLNLAGDSAASYRYAEAVVVLGGLAAVALVVYLDRERLLARLGVE